MDHLGCYNTDQKKTDEVQKLLEHLHLKYVPESIDTSPQSQLKIVAFADYLGSERQKATQLQVQDGLTPSERLQGITSAISNFNALAEWQKKLCDYLYDKKSGGDVCTLCHARRLINARNVTKDAQSNYYLI